MQYVERSWFVQQLISESGLKLYTNFSLYQKTINIITSCWSAKKNHTRWKLVLKKLIILEDNASGVQVGDIEQVIIEFVSNQINLNLIDDF
jgi:Fe-S cluster assembly ATPase SufC